MPRGVTPGPEAVLDTLDAGAADAAERAGDLPLLEPPPFPRVAACASAPSVVMTWDGRHRLALHGIVSDLGSAAGGIEAACPAASADERVVLGDPSDARLWQRAQPLRLIADDGSEVTLAFQTASENGLPELGQFVFDEQPGDAVDLLIEATGSWGGTLELRHADGSLALWFGRAPRVDALAVPKELSLAAGALEYRAAGDCSGHAAAAAQQMLAFRQLDVQLGELERTVESGAQRLLERWVFTNAGLSESIDPGACGRVALGLVQAALWPGCHDVLQLTSPSNGNSESDASSAAPSSNGLLRCGAQIFVQALPEECGTDHGQAVGQGPLGTACQSGDDCEEGARCRNGSCEKPPECMRRSDCAEGSVCLCAGAAGQHGVVPFNVCVPAACTRRDDCGGFECASSAGPSCSGVPGALYCLKSGDACESLADCSGSCRRDAEERWSCGPDANCD